MSDAESFFGIERVAGDFTRDGRGRPLLVPKGAPPGVRAPYTRASSFADRVEDKEFIHRWEQRYLARAMSNPANSDLADLAHAEIYTTGFDKPEDDENKASGRALDDIIKRALDRQGIHHRADRGTTIHKWAEDESRMWDVPEHLQPYLKGYWARLKNDGIKVLVVEMRVANDEVMSAGTFDSICWHPAYGWVTCDIKTGKISLGYAVQEAIYANGDLYDVTNDERAPLESLTGGEVVNRDVGLIFQVTAEGTKIIEVDLVRGWAIAKAIKVVHDEMRSDIFTELPARSLEDRILAAETAEELKGVWDETKTDWGTKHIAAAKKRRAELEAA